MSAITNCPHCNHEIDTNTNVKDETLKPKEGDLSVCFYCATVLVFGKDLKQRVATKSELEVLEKEDPEVHNELMKHGAAVMKYRTHGFEEEPKPIDN